MKIVAAHNSDPEIRQHSSAGGVFSMLAQQILTKGGIVYGVGFDQNWKIVHKRIADIPSLSTIRGSKYAYSYLGTSISDALADLENGRQVLFSGTPCQIAAIRKRAGLNPQLLLVEVVCHGAPKAYYWERYLEEICARKKRTPKDISHINFRDKISGWKNYNFTIQFKDGKSFSQLHDDNLYMRAFLQDYTLRDACFRCPFKYPDGSKADITIGDFWGIGQVAPDIDNNKGTTIIIAKTETGIQAINNIGDREYNLDQIAIYNPAIISSPKEPVNRSEFISCAQNQPLVAILQQFIGQNLIRRIYIKLARLKHLIIKRII